MGASSATRARVRRSVGPEMLSAAMTSPAGPRTGTAIALRPASSSSAVVAKPSRRTRSSSVVEGGAADDRVRRQPRQPPGGQLGRAEGEEDLAVGGAVVVDAAPDPLAGAEEVAAVDLGEVVDAVGGGDREVDRLAARLGDRLERGVGELDEVALDAAAMGEAQDRGAGLELAALAGLVDEAVALERGEQPRGGALGQVGGLGEVAQAHRLLAVEQAGEHLAGAVDRLRALSGRAHVEVLFHGGWNCSSIRG